MSKKKLLICIAFIFVLTLIISANAYAAEDPDYLCFTAGEGGVEIFMEKYDPEHDGVDTPTVELEYLIDGENWTTFKIKESESDEDYTTVQLPNVGDKVYFRAGGDGTNDAFAKDCNSIMDSNYNRFKIKDERKVSLSGNIMSLLDAENFETLKKVPDFAFVGLFSEDANTNGNIKSIEGLKLPATRLGKYCYAYMFNSCHSLTEISEDLLPAKTLAEGCYQDMFSDCILLNAVPKLPATKLADKCYFDMFFGCWTLKAVPENLLSSAEKLAKSCYCNMFSWCIELEIIPDLPSTQLAESCYEGMFSNCTKLVEVPDDLLPATVLADYCYRDMFNYCSSLTEAPNLPAKALAERCYSGMFCECRLLKTASDLPARKLAPYCYRWMFNGCSSLEEAPILYASELCEGCYTQMFLGCDELTEITAYFTDWSFDTFGNYPTEDWVDGIDTYEGFFHCVKDLDITVEKGDSTIPENWKFDNTLEPLPPEIDFPWWFIPFIFGGTGSGSSSSSEPSTPVTPVIPNASYDKCTKTSDCPMYVYYDLDTTKWYHDGIHFCLDNGLMNGVGSYTFDPDGTTTRPMMVTILSRMDGCDTEGGASWDEVGKAWAKTYGISDGIPEEGNITREEFATMLYRYAQKEGKGFTGAWMFLLDFKDADKVSSWASEAVHWCVMKGILQGRTGLYEGMLDPQATLTRAEASAMIQRFCEVK